MVQWISCELKVEMCERIVSAPDDLFCEMDVERLVNLIVKDAHALWETARSDRVCSR
jgi:hypothetical protein